MSQILNEVKLDMRLTHDKFDDNLLVLITQARYDLMIGGVSERVALDGSHVLVNRAIVHYVRYTFPMDMDSRRLEFHLRAYDSLKHSLALGKVGVFNA